GQKHIERGEIVRVVGIGIGVDPAGRKVADHPGPGRKRMLAQDRTVELEVDGLLDDDAFDGAEERLAAAAWLQGCGRLGCADAGWTHDANGVGPLAQTTARW